MLNFRTLENVSKGDMKRIGREQTQIAKIIYNQCNQNMSNLNLILYFIDFNNVNICKFKCDILVTLART